MWYGPTHVSSTFSTALTRDPPYCFIISECRTFIHTPNFCVSHQNWPFLHTNSIPEDPRSISVNPSSNLRRSHCSKGRSNWRYATNPFEVPKLSSLYKRNLFLNIQRKHGQVKDTTAQSHLLFTSRGLSVPVHVQHKTWGQQHVTRCEMDVCFFYFGIFGDGTQ